MSWLKRALLSFIEGLMRVQSLYTWIKFIVAGIVIGAAIGVSIFSNLIVGTAVGAAFGVCLAVFMGKRFID